MLTYSERKTFAQHGAKALDATVAEAVAAVAAERKAEYAASVAKFDARNKATPFTEDEYKAARAVRDMLGWHKVVRVNAKSVTVETGYSWTDRIDRAKVLEVRS